MASQIDVIVDKLKQIFDEATSGRLSDREITEETSLFDDLELDSLDVLELVFGIESAWDIHVADDEMGSLITVGDVIDFIVRKSAIEVPDGSA